MTQTTFKCFRLSAVVTTEEPEGHSNFAVNDIAQHGSKTK